MQSAVKIARAKDWPGFVAALRDYHSPQQNVVYADAQGNIGFVAAGRVPVIVTRKKYVRKPKKGPPGLALCTNEKTVMVRPREPERESSG